MKKCFSPSRLILCLFFLFGSRAVHAQYRLDHWTTDNGLPQNSIRDIVQTRDGYIWLATHDGLVRFDGVRFTVFNKSNSPGIIANRFIRLIEDGQGDLWAATEYVGLTRLHQGRFVTYTTETGLPGNRIEVLGEDGYGNLMFFCGSHLFRWLDEKFQPADDLSLPADALQENRQKQAPRLPYDFLFPPNFPDLRIRWFAKGELFSLALSGFPNKIDNIVPEPDEQGNFWFANDEGLVKTRDGHVVNTYTMNSGLPGKWARWVYGQGPLQVLTMRGDGSLWLTEVDSMQSRLVATRLPESRGLPPYLGYVDREGNIWIGTLYDGLYRARPQSITTYAKAQGLISSEVYPVFEDRAGTIWAGSERLFRFKDGVFTAYPAKIPSEILSIRSIYQDRAGQLWVNGKWRLEDGRLVRGISSDMLDSAGIVWSMSEDRQGAYWFGTESGGVLRYQNGVVRRYTTEDGLAGNETRVIIQDSAGGIWLGSYGGLTHYKDGRFTAWTEHEGIPGNTVRALYQDNDGVLWIGTYDSGLGRFKDGRFTRYTLKDGLYNNGVFQILEDSAGWFWMSCNQGIYRVRKQELNDFAEGKTKAITCISYNKSDGMLNAECNGGRWPAGVRARDGKLWFPTMDGVAVVDPATMPTNAQPPPVMIEAIKIDNEETADTTTRSAFQITPRQEDFEIQYTALSFINSQNLRFKYKLEGLDNDWVDAGTRRTAYFSHVPPGKYTFRVIAANSDGVWNTEGKSVRITVLPPFYRTWWFLTLAVLAAGGAVFAAFKSRVRQIERRQAAQQAFARQLLQSQEGERKRIAAEIHDGLGQTLAIIKNRALLGGSASTDLEAAKEQFELIAAQSTHAIDEAKDISYNLRPYLLDRLGLSQALESMIGKVADASGIRFTTEIVDLDGLFAPDEEINLYRIAQECLNNIVKHSGASAATVRLRREQDSVELVVSDNGKGFVESGFADSADQGQDAGSAPAGRKAAQPGRGVSQAKRGFGLMGIRERARLFHAAPTVHSVPGDGTTIAIRFARQPASTKDAGRAKSDGNGQ
ncbi:MAG TPA: two-component regulator propeller domain-containing protein [Blastocatellia bacterium]